MRQQQQTLDTAPFGNTLTCSTPTCICRTRRATTGCTRSMLTTRPTCSWLAVSSSTWRGAPPSASDPTSPSSWRPTAVCAAASGAPAAAVNPYKGTGCEVRSEFLSTRVPRNVVRKGVKPQLPTIDSNRDLFDAMSTSLHR